MSWPHILISEHGVLVMWVNKPFEETKNDRILNKYQAKHDMRKNMYILEGGQTHKLQFTYSSASHKGTSVIPPTNLNINLVDRCLSAHRWAATKPALSSLSAFISASPVGWDFLLLFWHDNWIPKPRSITLRSPGRTLLSIRHTRTYAIRHMRGPV